MANLKTNEKQILEKLLRMSGGGVLNFTNRSFHDFFRDDLGINIYDTRFAATGESKAKRLREFWRTESNKIVGEAILRFVEYIEVQISLENMKAADYPENLKKLARDMANRLTGNKVEQKTIITEDLFIKTDFDDVPFEQLGLEGALVDVMNQRIDEIKRCLGSKSSLAVIFLCGSTLEGILLSFAARQPKKWNAAKSAPLDRDGKVKQFHEWTLANFIDVAGEVRAIGEDVKKYSHALREFRNYIHPYQQMSSGFHPDQHTAMISWKVLKAAMFQLSKYKN